MSIEDRVRELKRRYIYKKELFRRGSSVNLGYYPTDVYKLIKQGCFQAVMLETGYRIIKTSFDKWLDNE